MRRVILPLLLSLLVCAGLASIPAPASAADTPSACTADDSQCRNCAPGATCCKLSGACIDGLDQCPASGCFQNGACQIDDLCVVGSAAPEPKPGPCSDAQSKCSGCPDGAFCCEATGDCVLPDTDQCRFTQCFSAAGCDGTKMCEKGGVTPTPAPTGTPAPTSSGGTTPTPAPTSSGSTPTPVPSGATPTPGPSSSAGPSPAPGQCRTLELVNNSSEVIWIGGKGGAVVPSCITSQTSCLTSVEHVSGDLTKCSCSGGSTLDGTISCPAGSTAARNGAGALICRCTGTGDCGAPDEENTCATTGDGNVCFWTLPEPKRDGTPANKYRLAQGEKATFCLPQPADIGSQVAPVWWSGGVFARTGCKDPDGTDCATANCGASPNAACPPEKGGDKPLTLAEFTLQSNDKDFYDVTIIDGINVAVEMKPIPPTLPTAPPGADRDYWCQAAGGSSAAGKLDACSWDFAPTVPDPANPDSGTDYTSLLLHNGAPCSSTAEQTGCVGTKGNVDEIGKSYCTAPSGGTCLYSCETDADCASNWGGAMKCRAVQYTASETRKFCQCDEATDCAGSKLGSYCGTQFIPGVATPYMQMCGAKTRGWWTANVFCADPSTKYGPLDCGASLGNGQSGDTTLSQLFGCIGANAASCYNSNQSAGDNCCGCATKSGTALAKFWPTAASLECANGHNNPTWNTKAQPWLVFLKKGCPTAYTYAYDDSTSTFTCQSPGKLNEVGYTVTFGSVTAPKIADCGTSASARVDGTATTAAGDAGCTAFLSRAVGRRATLESGAGTATTTIRASDWIETATFRLGRPRALVSREESPDAVAWLSYPITRRSRDGDPRREGIVVTDEVGTHRLDTRSAERLLIPAGTGAAGGTPELPLAGLFDAYTCYRMTPGAGAPLPRLVEATYSDESGTHGIVIRDVPDSLCIEADMGDGLGRSQTSVACYRTRSSEGGTRTVPRDVVELPVRRGRSPRDVIELAVNDRFGTGTLLRGSAEELCVPAEIEDRGRAIR